MENETKVKIISYLKDRQLDDGGFFFAGVKPSAGKDTYFATLALTILGANFDGRAVLDFWDGKIKDDFLREYSIMYWAIESLNILKSEAFLFKEKWKRRAASLVEDKLRLRNFSANDIGKLPVGFDADMLAIALIGKRLEDLFYLLSLCFALGIAVDDHEAVRFIAELQQEDGGFSEKIISDSPTTLWSLKILKLLNRPFPKREKIRSFLQIQFLSSDDLENLYCVIGGLLLLGENLLPRKNKALDFVFSCQRANGGFSRARTIGIATIENTFQAVKVLLNYGTI
jgi:hypothetical protein